ncbi:hypothetical protein CLAIMM_01499 [Cladophialophora immunda]|nr:hypothetical protein CLAIMM_01499 [Cladophialophora immunda]
MVNQASKSKADLEIATGALQGHWERYFGDKVDCILDAECRAEKDRPHLPGCREEDFQVSDAAIGGAEASRGPKIPHQYQETGHWCCSASKSNSQSHGIIGLNGKSMAQNGEGRPSQTISLSGARPMDWLFIGPQIRPR